MHGTALVAMLLASIVAGRAINKPRGDRVADPGAVINTICTDPSTTLVSHDINVAQLAICRGIAGTIEQCGGNPETTTGASGTALFTLSAATAGQTIDISKGRWEECVFTAQAQCGDSPFTTQCVGGANGNSGNVNVALTANT